MLASLWFSGCRYVEPENLEPLNKIDEFVKAVEKNEFTTAFALLTEDAQSKIDYNQFSGTSGDFHGIINAFRQAGITARNERPKDEPSFKVSKLRGREGAVRFVIVQENGEWKIANILEDSLEPNKK